MRCFSAASGPHSPGRSIIVVSRSLSAGLRSTSGERRCHPPLVQGGRVKPEVKPLNPRISPRLDVFMSATDQVNRSRAEQCPSLAVPSEGDGRPGVEAGTAAVDYADPNQTAQVALEAIRQARSPTEPVARVAVVKVMSRK